MFVEYILKSPKQPKLAYEKRKFLPYGNNYYCLNIDYIIRFY